MCDQYYIYHYRSVIYGTATVAVVVVVSVAWQFIYYCFDAFAAPDAFVGGDLSHREMGWDSLSCEARTATHETQPLRCAQPFIVTESLLC